MDKTDSDNIVLGDLSTAAVNSLRKSILAAAAAAAA